MNWMEQATRTRVMVSTIFAAAVLALGATCATSAEPPTAVQTALTIEVHGPTVRRVYYYQGHHYPYYYRGHYYRYHYHGHYYNHRYHRHGHWRYY